MPMQPQIHAASVWLKTCPCQRHLQHL